MLRACALQYGRS
jgi:hypothetical protein